MSLKTFDLGYVGGVISETVGSASVPIYQNAGTATAVTSIDATLLSGVANINTTGNASTATHATSATNADEATHATSADTATKATQDANGNIITNTYLTADSALDATKLTGIASVDTTGNAATATSATTAAACTGNSATATTAAACTGNSATATTAAACTGNSATATKAEQDSDGNTISATYATKAEDAAKLPLSGGTMTGNIVYDDEFGIYNGGDTNNFTDVGYDYANRSGAVLALRNANDTESSGTFGLIARNATNSTWLSGTPDGSLKWHGHEVECLDTDSTTNNDDFVLRYSNGLQIVCGYQGGGISPGGQTVTFKAPFAYAPRVITQVFFNLTTTQCTRVFNETSTGFDFVGTSNDEYCHYAYFTYIAIGRWKQ